MKKTGKWSMQECECALLSPDGVVEQVGVLSLPRELVDKTAPGVYLGSFVIKPDYKTRKIGAVLVGLQPYAVPSAKTAKVAA